MWYNITSRGVEARQCRASTGVPHVNENRYITLGCDRNKLRKIEFTLTVLLFFEQ
ncbi:hypothetical protein [Nostoc flagelliforme]|uniref:hypothetical protein n=1 Tax=Nostoc flagelliforme TaxID=1306274 RepID=UPI0012FE409F